MSDTRNDILNRLRSALKTPADTHVRKHTVAGSAFQTDPMAAKEWMPATPTDLASQLKTIKVKAKALAIEWVHCHSMLEAKQWLHMANESDKWTSIATHPDSDLETLTEDTTVPLHVISSAADIHKEKLALVPVSITRCACLVAQTGSIFITPKHGGRRLSALAPHHIVLVRSTDIVSDLPEAWASQEGKLNNSSFLSVITGPSRTGDIERILVLGAHGPKKLTLLYVP